MPGTDQSEAAHKRHPRVPWTSSARLGADTPVTRWRRFGSALEVDRTEGQLVDPQVGNELG